MTNRKIHLSVFVEVSEVTIDDHTLSAQILGSRRHEAAPTGRVEVLGLRNENNRVLSHSVDKVLGRFRRAFIVCIDHLHGVCWTENLP